MVKEYELGSLPERTPFKMTRVRNREGTVTITPEFREIGVSSLEDDDVIAFVDTDGR